MLEWTMARENHVLDYNIALSFIEKELKPT